MYYACLELKEIKDCKADAIIKIPFEKREQARTYIIEHFDPKFHSKCWTE